MKKTLTIFCAAVASVVFAATANAQFNGGVIGGATFSSAKPGEWNVTNIVQGHIGATLKISLPLGFAVQPSLVYQMKGTKVQGDGTEGSAFDYKAGYIEVPVSVQWGPDLLIMRPYFECVPFFGYALNNRYSGGGAESKNDWTGLDRWEYGVGLGAGLEVWHFQISARYNWALGSMFDAKKEISSTDAFAARMKSSVGDRNNISGVTLSLAVMF